MRNVTPSSPICFSLKSRYLAAAVSLFVICVLGSWVAYSNITGMIDNVTSHSRYQLQLSSDLNDFTESFYNIEKILQYSPQLSKDLIYKQLNDNINKADAALKRIEHGHWVVDSQQKETILELRNYLSTYHLHINWLVESDKKVYQNQLSGEKTIDVFVANLRPILAKVHDGIEQLEDDLKTVSVIENNGLIDVQDNLLLILLIATLLVVGFLLVNYIALNKWVFYPLRTLSDNISNKGNLAAVTVSYEMNALISAIDEKCSQNKAREDELEYQVHHDPLTNLPNRALLRNNMQAAINNADKTGQCFTLLMIDLDRFKDINDTLGHHVGDKVLCEISERFSVELTPEDVIARLGGDEFAVLLHDADVEKARVTAKKLLKCFKKDLFMSGHRFNIGGSIGMAVYPWHARNEQELLQRADVAMYFAKRKNFGYAIYDKSEDKHDIRQLGFEVELRDAIKNDSLMLYYQPKVDVEKKRVVSAEVLLRWNHEEHGFIPAEEISLLAEKTGLIADLSKWVVRNAIEQLSRWSKNGIELPVSINLSVWNLQDPEFFSFVENVLNEYEVPADMITFEITESAVMSDPEGAMKTLQQLASLGASLSIDDYGTGFSSLQYLKILPVNEIKIDKSFVTDMVNYDNDAVIVRSIIDLSHNLGLSVVAEGVETQDVYDVLEILRCDVIQGYHVSRPIPSDKLEKWLSKNDNIYSPKADNVSYLYR